MSSYPSYSDSIPGVQYHSGSQFSFQDIPMELDQDWMTNVDPQLRNESILMNQWSEQPLQRYLTEPQKPLFTARPYPSQQYENLHQDFTSTQNGTAPFPYVYNRQICSPAPSSQERYSICSSALSPNSADNEWSRENLQQVDSFQLQENFDSSPLSRSTSRTSQQGLPDLIWPSKTFHHQLEQQVPGGVSLSQLQGIPDQGDVVYQEDEGYAENVEMVGVKTEMTGYNQDARMSVKQEATYPYRQSIDETLGHSLKDESSSSRRSSYQPVDQDVDAEGDIDADAEIEDEVASSEIVDEDIDIEIDNVDDDDEEYRPRGAHTVPTSSRRRRRATKSSPNTSPINTKRSKTRVTKSTSTPSKNYTTTNTNTATNTSSSNNSRNHRMPSPFQCPSCTKNNFANSAALQKHISSVHTRAFVCAYSFAGCESRFASKNEWKRHVGSQHLCLTFWRCDVGGCGNGKGGGSPSSLREGEGENSRSQSQSQTQSQSQSQANIDEHDHQTQTPTSTSHTQNHTHSHARSNHSNTSTNTNQATNTTKTNEFNRKDLFTQHLRRMHAPFAVKRQGKKVDSWEERVKELQVSSLRVRREAPWRTGCPVRGCGGIFEGKGGWDERMEHVGKHLERCGGFVGEVGIGGIYGGNLGGRGGDMGDEDEDKRIQRDIREGVDPEFLEWSLREGIVEERPGGGWRLCGSGSQGSGSGGSGESKTISSSSSAVVAISSSSTSTAGTRGFGMVNIKSEYDGGDEDVDAEGEDDI